MSRKVLGMESSLLGRLGFHEIVLWVFGGTSKGPQELVIPLGGVGSMM